MSTLSHCRLIKTPLIFIDNETPFSARQRLNLRCRCQSKVFSSWWAVLIGNFQIYSLHHNPDSLKNAFSFEKFRDTNSPSYITGSLTFFSKISIWSLKFEKSLQLQHQLSWCFHKNADTQNKPRKKSKHIELVWLGFQADIAQCFQFCFESHGFFHFRWEFNGEFFCFDTRSRAPSVKCSKVRSSFF